MKGATREANSCHVSRVTCHLSAFTLVELLVVISILGILAALTVPALKNFGKSDIAISASRQLLDAVARARQLAISQRTTVYMVFVPTNFWVVNGVSPPAAGNVWWTGLTPAQRAAATNLCDLQLTGYNFVAYGALGDQPGHHAWHYLGPWQTLPDGAFIAQWKFNSSAQPFSFTDPVDSSKFFQIYQFDYTNTIPFPTETATNGVRLPYIAFDYRGQLVSGRDEYLPLAQGSMAPAINPATKALQLGSPDVAEMPPGNSTNIAYRIAHIEWLTGRARLEFHKMGP